MGLPQLVQPTELQPRQAQGFFPRQPATEMLLNEAPEVMVELVGSLTFNRTAPG